MAKWSGKVSKVNERDWGSTTIFSWQLEGTNMWFRCSLNPDLVVGLCYEFEGESPNKIQLGSILRLAEFEVKEAAQAQQRDVVPPTSSPDYWRWKQMHDMAREEYYQWKDARADATRIVCAALDNDVLSLGSAKGLKLGILIGAIKKTTEELLETSNGKDD